MTRISRSSGAHARLSVDVKGVGVLPEALVIGIGVPFAILVISVLLCFLIYAICTIFRDEDVESPQLELLAMFVFCACCCVVALVWLCCLLISNSLSLEERNASAQESMQAAFAEAGYQNAIDDVILRYGEVVVIDKPALSCDGSEIAPAGSLSYYISDDGEMVRIYKDGMEIASVNNEGE